MKCIVIDDEPLAIEGMKMNIEKIDFLELIGTFTNALDANTFLQKNEVDLMFIDIEMPDITGKALQKSPRLAVQLMCIIIIFLKSNKPIFT